MALDGYYQSSSSPPPTSHSQLYLGSPGFGPATTTTTTSGGSPTRSTKNGINSSSKNIYQTSSSTQNYTTKNTTTQDEYPYTSVYRPVYATVPMINASSTSNASSPSSSSKFAAPRTTASSSTNPHNAALQLDTSFQTPVKHLEKIPSMPSDSKSPSPSYTPERRPLGPRLPPSNSGFTLISPSTVSNQTTPHSSSTTTKAFHRQTLSASSSSSSTSAHSSRCVLNQDSPSLLPSVSISATSSSSSSTPASPIKRIIQASKPLDVIETEPYFSEDPYQHQSFDRCSMFSSSTHASPIKRKEVIPQYSPQFVSSSTHSNNSSGTTSPLKPTSPSTSKLRHSHSKSLGHIQTISPSSPNSNHSSNGHTHSNSYSHISLQPSSPSDFSHYNNRVLLSRQKSTESSEDTDHLNSSGHSGRSAFSAYSGISSYSSSSYTSPQDQQQHLPSSKKLTQVPSNSTSISSSSVSSSASTSSNSSSSSSSSHSPRIPVTPPSSSSPTKQLYSNSHQSQLDYRYSQLEETFNTVRASSISPYESNNISPTKSSRKTAISATPESDESSTKIWQSFEKFTIDPDHHQQQQKPYISSTDTASTFSSDTIKATPSPLFSAGQGSRVGSGTLDLHRIQRSQTFSEISDDLLLPPPTRSYSTSSKSYSGFSNLSSSVRSSSYSTTDDSLMLRLDLPTIPDSRSQLDPSKLSSKDFERCEEPSLISSICLWIEYLNSRSEMTYETLSESLIGLFRHTVPTLGWVAAERITVPLLETLINSKFLSIDEEFGILVVDYRYSTTGVIPTLTGKGCYAPRTHVNNNNNNNGSCSHHGVDKTKTNQKNDSTLTPSYRCYSSRCFRTIPYKPVLPAMEDALKINDSDRVNWAKIWNLSDEDLGKLDKDLVQRQCAIQELIGTEEIYVRGLKAFLNVYGDYLSRAKPHVVPNQNKFWSDTFGCIQGLIESNDNQLLTHLKIRQVQQGPYIDSVADLILNWLKVARNPYLARASTYSYAMRVVASEKGKNELFAAWLDKAEHDPRLTRQQKFDFLVSSPFTRLCRYNLLFGRIKASTPKSNPEYDLWDRCIEECRSIVEDYNRIHGESEDISSIMTLEERIQFPSPEEKVDLRLWDSRRKIYYQGDVLRKGEYGIDYVDTHMILLDHYLILAKFKKDNLEKYLVSKRVSGESFFFFFSLIY